MLGHGGHAKMCRDILKQTGLFNLAGIVTDQANKGEVVSGHKVVGEDADLAELYEAGYRYAILGLGAVKNPRLRERLFNRLKSIGFFLPNLIHPNAIIEPSAKLGEGVHVMAGAIVGSEAVVQDNCILNSGCIVSHDCHLENNAHITPGAILGGNVSIGKNTIVGMGCTIYMGVKVGSNSVISNGLNIFRHIEDEEIVKK